MTNTNSMDAILDHLLFHKSILEENEDGGRINMYISAVRRAAEGRHRQIEDPWLRMVSTVFEMVESEGLDPWDVDLSSFASAYRKHLRKENFVDFITAGRLINIAWAILAQKTCSLRDKAEETEEISMDLMFGESAPWDLFLPEDPLEEATQKLKISPPLQPCVNHPERRSVGLLDLMDAFEEAKREADLMEEINKVRERLRGKQNIRPDISKKIHSENLEEDIDRVWRALSAINKDRIHISDLFIRSREEYVTVFLSLLFLAKEGKIKLSQSRIPVGNIAIKILVPHTERESLMEMEDLSAHEKVSINREREDSAVRQVSEEMIEVTA